MNAAQKLDVIAVGAHPDDVEIGCGGTLADLVRQGYRVGIIDLTDGEPTPLSSHRDERLAEAQDAARVLRIHERIILDLPNRKLFDSYEARVLLATQFRKFQPRLVLGLGSKTPLASPDHWQAMQITDAAVFYSRLTKWDSEFGNLPPHKISQQVYYSLNFEVPGSNPESGHFIYDISATLEQKVEAIRCYQTQFPTDKHHVFQRVEAMAGSFGAAAGFAAGERLWATKALGTRNLFGLLNMD